MLFAQKWFSTVQKVHQNGSKIMVQFIHGCICVLPPLKTVSAGEQGCKLIFNESDSLKQLNEVKKQDLMEYNFVQVIDFFFHHFYLQ